MSYIKQDESGGGDTYTLKAAQSGPDVDIQLDAAAGADSDVKLKAGTNITLTEASDTITIDAASGGSPGGANTQVQFNDGGSFGGDADFTFDKTAGAEQVKIDATSTEPLLKVVQQGTGTAIEVHDQATDTSVFQVGTDGKTSVGFAPGSGIGADTFYVQGRSSGQLWTATSLGSAAAPRFTYRSDLDTGMYFSGTNEVAFATGGSERMRLGSAGQIGIAGANYGTAGQVLTSQGSGAAPTWSAGGGGGSPGGSDTMVQFNDAGSFNGESTFVYNKTANSVGIGGSTSPGYALKVSGNADTSGQQQAARFLSNSDGSAASPRYSRLSSDDRGMYFPAADQIAFSTDGTERLRIADSGQIGIGGANYGAAGQVLTSAGAGAAPTWATPTPVTPVPKAVGTGLLVTDPFTFLAGSESNYPLWANINSTNSTAWSGFPTTTQAVFMPFQVPKGGTLAELCFRTSGITSGGTFQMGVYASSTVTNLPVGSALFTTSIALASSTEYEFAVSGVTGLAPGDILYIAWLGYTGNTGDSMNVGFSSLTGGQSGGYALNFPRRITGSNLLNFIGRQWTALRLDGITAGVFPTSIPASQAWDDTMIINTPLNMSARYT